MDNVRNGKPNTNYDLVLAELENYKAMINSGKQGRIEINFGQSREPSPGREGATKIVVVVRDYQVR